MRAMMSSRAMPVCVRKGSTRFLALVVTLSDSFSLPMRRTLSILSAFISFAIVTWCPPGPARRALALPPVLSGTHADGVADRAHLAFFLHDEIIVHAPREQADAAVAAVRDAAVTAGRLLFGDFPLDFRLDLRVSESADKD